MFLQLKADNYFCGSVHIGKLESIMSEGVSCNEHHAQNRPVAFQHNLQSQYKQPKNACHTYWHFVFPNILGEQHENYCKLF